MKWNALLTAGLLGALTATSTAGDIVPPREAEIIRDAVARNIPDQALRPTFVRLVSAIRRTENGRKDFELGVEHKDAKGIEKQAGWCASIVWKRWNDCPENEPYLYWLSRRYCPVNQEQWLKNVMYFLEKQQ
jgi:hypothetical protein